MALRRVVSTKTRGRKRDFRESRRIENRASLKGVNFYQ